MTDVHDQGGGSGGERAQGSMCTWGSSSLSDIVVESGDGGGELFEPSNWMKAAQSTGEAGDAALHFLLAPGHYR